eukprot:CAMPEP_0171676670 /NCGR_PEP_ID=MMETSP0990-20121206/54582_1 /TAXON_ID=483369 /ORGANISM="non described non described, Strain CCMP2098" /LENGTH=70 /DNA_ID=CAMNT_0012262913 /DNA_START=11 /DNA_END=220 /DNA_ORIENTATION=+
MAEEVHFAPSITTRDTACAEKDKDEVVVAVGDEEGTDVTTRTSDGSSTENNGVSGIGGGEMMARRAVMSK